MAFGTLAALGLGAAGAGLLGGLFGDENEGAMPQQQSSTQGFAALPQEVKDAWLQQYLPQLLQQYQNKPMTTPLGQAPTGPFASQGLQELQAHSNQVGGLFGNQGTGVNPLGAVEPFNQFQQNALSSLGGGLAGLQNELPGYQNLYNENVLNPQLAEIDRQLGMGNNRLLGRKAGGGNLGVLGSSAIGTQLAELQDSANRLKLNAREHAFTSGIGLRNQTLQDMLRAGGTIQNQNQNTLGAIYPQLQQTLPQNKLGQLGQGLSIFPQSNLSNGTGPIAGRPDTWARVGNAGLQGLGALSGLGGMEGFGGAPSFNNQFAGGGSNWGFGAPPAMGGYQLGNSYIRPY
jgi:hypothetical protein